MNTMQMQALNDLALKIRTSSASRVKAFMNECEWAYKALGIFKLEGPVAPAKKAYRVWAIEEAGLSDNEAVNYPGIWERWGKHGSTRKLTAAQLALVCPKALQKIESVSLGGNGSNKKKLVRWCHNRLKNDQKVSYTDVSFKVAALREGRNSNKPKARAQNNEVRVSFLGLKPNMTNRQLRNAVMRFCIEYQKKETPLAIL